LPSLSSDRIGCEPHVGHRALVGRRTELAEVLPRGEAIGADDDEEDEDVSSM
jgi:hypothetical protein